MPRFPADISFPAIACLAIASGFLSRPAHAQAPRVVDFTAARWTASAGGDGALRTLVIVDRAWSWHEASDIALRLGATLARADSSAELSFLESRCDHPGAFDCGGPWIGGFREPQGAWLWTNGAPVPAFGWRPFRPAQSIVFESALMMSGIDGPDGRWLDVFPDPDAGVSTRAALFTWSSFVDCDADDLPDSLEIVRDPSLDSNGDGALDSCSPPNRSDLNGDDRVNALDLAILLNAWGTSDASADIDGNGTVAAPDLSILLNDWTNG